MFLGWEVGGSRDSSDTGVIEGWRGLRHREWYLREGEGGLWQLSEAEEVRLELTGHQESPRRVMARCKWRWEVF